MGVLWFVAARGGSAADGGAGELDSGSANDEERFAHGTNACIVCTSTLELGIDVGDLDLVFQANGPSTVSSFMQRMGRTGRRAGTNANTTFLCEDPKAVLQAAALIELAREGWVERVADQGRCWPVLVHQVLALTLQHGAISAERSWGQLSRVPDFRAITGSELAETIEHMKEEDFLFEAGGLLSMGPKAEKSEAMGLVVAIRPARAGRAASGGLAGGARVFRAARLRLAEEAIRSVRRSSRAG